ASDRAITVSRSLAPVVVEIEPVVGRSSAVVLQALRITVRPYAKNALAFGARGINVVGEVLEAQVITPSAAVEGKTHHDRHVQYGRQLERTQRESGRLPEEIAAYARVVTP